MKREWILIPATCLVLVLSGVAEAQGATRMSAPGKGMRIDTGKRITAAASGARVSSSRGAADIRRSQTGGLGSLNRGRGPGSLPQRGYSQGLNGLGNAPLGGLLEQYLYNEYGGRRYDPYGAEKEYAKAHRDAAIANAIVNVVGILATANQPQPPYAVYGAPASAPPVVVAPRGHVERQRILVQEGRTEEYQVWIPEYTIPETGEVVIGHHETRRREIAPVYEEREVWVPVP